MKPLALALLLAATTATAQDRPHDRPNLSEAEAALHTRAAYLGGWAPGSAAGAPVASLGGGDDGVGDMADLGVDGCGARRYAVGPGRRGPLPVRP